VHGAVENPLVDAVPIHRGRLGGYGVTCQDLILARSARSVVDGRRPTGHVVEYVGPGAIESLSMEGG